MSDSIDPAKPNVCPVCGAALSDVAGGLCPRCLMADAAQPTNAPGSGPPSQAEVTAAFPQFEIIELIGAGGMGTVWRARQPKLNRHVALKLLPASLAEHDPAFAERFEREGQLLARLHHPNIVTVHDSGRAGNFFYLLMEFVDGVNLRQAMRASRFTSQQALAIVPKICDALQYAHEEGVLHRDIKPENILLDAKGRVKLVDFGIAKLVAETEAVPAGAAAPDAPAASGGSLTLGDATLGTPNYMAPEQIDKPADVDHRADIYSLGVVFYELLTGELPLGKFAPPSEKSAADPRLDGIVQQALQKERERRQQSVGEMRTQVETIAGSPMSATAKPVEHNFLHFEGFTKFRSRTALRFAQLAGVGCLGFLGYIPGWERLFGLFGFFGFIGIAYVIEAFARPNAGRSGNSPQQPRAGVLSLERPSRMAILWASLLGVACLLVLAAGVVSHKFAKLERADEEFVATSVIKVSGNPAASWVLEKYVSPSTAKDSRLRIKKITDGTLVEFTASAKNPHTAAETANALASASLENLKAEFANQPEISVSLLQRAQAAPGITRPVIAPNVLALGFFFAPFLVLPGTILLIFGHRRRCQAESGKSDSKPNRPTAFVAFGIILCILGITSLLRTTGLWASRQPLAESPFVLGMCPTSEVIRAGLSNPLLSAAWIELAHRQLTAVEAGQILDGLTAWLQKEHPTRFSQAKSGLDSLLRQLAKRRLASDDQLVRFLEAYEGSIRCEPLLRLREGAQKLDLTVKCRNSDQAPLGLVMLNEIQAVTVDGRSLVLQRSSTYCLAYDLYDSLPVPALAPGKHMVKLEVLSALVPEAEMASLDPNAPSSGWPLAKKRWTRTIETQLMVYTRDAVIVSQTQEPALNPVASGALSVKQVTVRSAGDKDQAVLSFNMSFQLPVPISFDVTLRAGDQSIPCGKLWSGALWTPDSLAYARSGQELTSTLVLLSPEIGDASIILTPNPKYVEHIGTVDRIWGKEIVFRRVPLTRQDLTNPIVPASPVAQPNQPMETGWDEAVDGVQLRLQADRVIWRTDETPTLNVDIRNQGTDIPWVARSLEMAKVEVDGERYVWSGAIHVPVGVLPPGKRIDPIPVSLDANWRTEKDFKPLAMTPGKHKIRVAIELKPSDGKSTASGWAFTNTVAIEITPSPVPLDPSINHCSQPHPKTHVVYFERTANLYLGESTTRRMSTRNESVPGA